MARARLSLSRLKSGSGRAFEAARWLIFSQPRPCLARDWFLSGLSWHPRLSCESSSRHECHFGVDQPRPDLSVVNWLATVDEDSVFLSVISIAGLGRGIERLDHGARRERLQRWLRRNFRVRFEGRTLPVDAEVAEAWGLIVAKASREGTTLNPMDAFLAATAQCRGLVIATRNTD